MGDQEAEAAASWLSEQVGVRGGVWARLKNRGGTSTGLERGVWYAIRSHDAERKIVGLAVGDEEAGVHINFLTFLPDLPEKTIVYSDGQWGKRPPGMRYVARCPKGHKYELGGAPPLNGQTTSCPECQRDYPWEAE